MSPDLNLHPILIDAQHLDDLQWVYQGEVDRRPESMDINDLAVEVDWSKKRMIWMIYGSCHLGLIRQVLDRITECSKVVVLESESADAYHLLPAEREGLRQHVIEEKLSIIVGGQLNQRAEKLIEVIDIDCMDGWKPILSQQQMKRRPADIRELFERLAAGINLKVMGKATHLNVTLPYLRNALINAPLACEEDRLLQWHGARKDRPVLIVAAGPSLNKQLPLLAENQDLFTIVAVDMVWPILQKHGIVPDAILALDPMSVPSWPRNQIAETTAFCVDLGCAPRLVWSNDQNHIMTTCSLSVYKILREIGVRACLLTTGGSVATSAFGLAERLGANPIVFIGQDLALTDGKDHAEGYLDPYNTDLLSVRTEAGFDVEGYYGGRLRTERQLLFYKTWFEGRIQALPEKMIINATEGGARIQGALQLPFATVCQEIRAARLIKTPLLEPFRRGIDPAHMQRLQEGLKRLKEGVADLGKRADEAHALCQRMGRRPSKKQLSRLDQLNDAIKNHPPASKMFVDVLCMVQLDKIRYTTHIRENMDGMADAVRKYDEIYESIRSAVQLGDKLLDHIGRFYQRVSEHGALDPDLLKDAFLDYTPQAH